MGRGVPSVALVVVLWTAFLHPRASSAQEWFDDYKLGVDALEAGKPERAAQFLARALRKRPEPGVNVVTYGTNRVREYYPLLKLSEAQILSGDLEAAAETLRRSNELGIEPADARAQLQLRHREAVEKKEAKLRAEAPTPPAAPPSLPEPVDVPPKRAEPPPVPDTGTLVVRSSPESGASVLADGHLLGVTPLEVELEIGEYQISILKQGSRSERFSVRIEAGKTNILTHRLVAVAAAAPDPPPVRKAPPVEPAATTLVLVSEPAGAAVYFDDELEGSTDPVTGRLRLSQVSPGRHRVRMTLGGHEDLVDELELEAGRETLYRGLLTSRAPSPVAPSDRVPAASVIPPANESSRPGFALLAAVVALSGLLFGARRWNRRNEGVRDATVTASEWRSAESQGTETRVSEQASRFGEFRLLRPLGRGGMASVFLAERNGECFALKRPSSELLAEPEFRERFLREASIGLTLHHPNIIRIFERGEVDGAPYFTMELIDGDTLRAKLDRGEIHGAREAAEIVLQVAEALDYAHLKGVVHRDLKPGNIMVQRNGTVKVMDYGIARARRFEGLTATGAFLGTPNYVAPETAEGRPVDARSDLYALGIIFYEMLTGQRPFDSDNPLVTLKRHCTEPPTPPSLITPAVPRRVEAMVLRLLAKSPDDRYRDAEELLVELRQFLSQNA